MSLEEEILTCYNLGCTIKQFKASENSEKSCTFHPGQPFFHDAYKGWSCCNRKSVDFTEFLSMKGCTTSFHSNVKPPEPEKPAKEIIDEIEEVNVAQPKVKALERPSPDSLMITLKSELSQSLKNQTYNSPDPIKIAKGVDNFEVTVGKACTNNGCTAKFEGVQSNNEICNYHPGVPIFHEGLKYWSCCKKRTTEFQTFLEQKGCAQGVHVWFKPKEDNEDSEGKRLITCRFDWHQTATDVIVAVYGKKFDPSQSHVKANGVKLKVELFFPEEQAYFKQEWMLTGIIEAEKSSTLMTPTKIEVKLKKAEPVSWRTLDLPIEKVENSTKNIKDNIKDVGVTPLDLDDL